MGYKYFSCSIFYAVDRADFTTNISAVVEADKIPVDKRVIKLANDTGLSALDLALFGGEDYQLIFTSAQENAVALQELADSSGVLFTKIGQTHQGSPRGDWPCARHRYCLPELEFTDY